MDAGVMRASHQDVTNPTVYAAASRWIRKHVREHPGRPFFAFVHLWDVHFDFIPPPPYDTRFDPAYAGAIDGRDFFFDPAISAGLSQRDRQHLIALYDGEIAWTDSFVGMLLGDLDQLGLAESTVVAVTSDHGTEFFEHGGKGHRTTLFDELLCIPLILRAPGRLPAGARVAAQTRSIDVGPTLLELAGLPVPAGIAGSSLVGLARGQGLEFDNTSISELESVGLDLRAVRTERVKLLRDTQGGQSVWFDLALDPSEHQPLAAPPGGAADLERCARAEAELERAIRARPADPASAAVTQAVLRQLEQLGYTDGADGLER
jgi:arylsulfatase A-like enzyme